jgi:hypothetical protein
MPPWTFEIVLLLYNNIYYLHDLIQKNHIHPSITP